MSPGTTCAGPRIRMREVRRGDVDRWLEDEHGDP